MQKKNKVHSYTVLFEPLSEGGYNVVFPAIPEICTFGKTLQEAKQMAADALRCYLEGMAKERSSFPKDIRRQPRVERLSVELER